MGITKTLIIFMLVIIGFFIVGMFGSYPYFVYYAFFLAFVFGAHLKIRARKSDQVDTEQLLIDLKGGAAIFALSLVIFIAGWMYIREFELLLVALVFLLFGSLANLLIDVLVKFEKI